MSEWNIEGGAPDWVSFVNKTIDTGIKFKFKPLKEHIGDKIKLTYILSDSNQRDPLSSIF